MKITPGIEKIERWNSDALAAAVMYQAPAWPTLTAAEKTELPIETALGNLQWECENQAAQRGSTVVELRDVLATTKWAEADAVRTLRNAGLWPDDVGNKTNSSQAIPGATLITRDNIDSLEVAVNDQRDELEDGCQTWAITYGGGQRGDMTVWPNGRGAVSWGGDSVWGDWDYDNNILHLDDGGRVDIDGNALD